MTAAILNHIWQSTLVALGAALLALALRRASSTVRYGLWFAASVKFLIPFALLAMLGQATLGKVLPPVHVAAQTRFVETAAQPFSQGPLSQLPLAQPSTLSQLPIAQAPATPVASAPIPLAPRLDLLAFLPWALLAAWAVGCAAVLVRWMVRWGRVRTALNAATPLAWPAPMPVLASSSMLEPGLIGLIRPVLLIPESLPEHLGQVEIAAIVAHEAAHLRRRDNLTATVHMLVEALFWFHPLVWWIGGRMITEREVACDEAVVRAGHDRTAYARSLLESARLYLQSPLSCVAGASGSDLKTRVQTIMTAPLSSPLSLAKKALLLAAGSFAVATPVMAGLVVASPEGRQAVAHAAAVTSTALGVTLRAPDSDAAKPTILSRAEAVLSPALSVAALDVPATPLARDITPPVVEAPPPLAAPAPVQLAVATPPAPRASAAKPTDPAEIKRQAAEFVQSYGAFTSGYFGNAHLTGRWDSPLCVEIAGLTPAQETAARLRIAEVAKTVDVGVGVAGCGRANLQIAFTNDPQGALDRLVKKTQRILGDYTSDTHTIKTVTLPIQAWYVTNEATSAQNGAKTGTEGLKVDVVYQNYQDPTVGHAPAPSFNDPGPGQNICCDFSFPSDNLDGGGRARSASGRAFSHVLVLVDLRKTQGRTLGLLTDYVAMVSLAQPRDLSQCKALPSITDLFAACPGRPAVDGLTSADTAYLSALYKQKGPGLETGIADRMAGILGKDDARAETAPARPIKPAAFVAPPAGPARLTLTPAAVTTNPADAKQQAQSFVQAASGSRALRWTIGRWRHPICVRVVGLAPDQAQALRIRVEDLAREVGVGAQAAGCQRSDVEIGFTNDPQGMLNAAATRKGDILGDPTSDTRGVKTVNHAIQSWYRTNELDEAAADSQTWGVARRGLVNAMVIVDLRRVGGKSLRQLADDTAMLALSEQRPDHPCSALPSVIDLSADACPGRKAPEGLTSADAAYLLALYEQNSAGTQSETRSAVAERMAGLLGGTRVAKLGSPQPWPAVMPHPVSPTGAAPVWFEGVPTAVGG